MKLKSRRDILLIHHVFLYLCVSHTTALYFHISEIERKCFIETLGKKPNETVVIGNYKCELYDPKTAGIMPSSPGNGMHVEIRDPEDKIILSKIYGSEGKFSFSSNILGDHEICLSSNTTKWSSGSQLRVHLDFQVGDHTTDNGNSAEKELLTRYQLRFGKLLDKVEQILEEHNSQRFQENYFRQTCDSIDQKILLWSVIQTCIVILIGILLRFSIRSDFHQHKIAIALVSDNINLPYIPISSLQQKAPKTGILNNGQ